MVNASSRPDDPDLRSESVEADLLGGLAERRRDLIGVAGLGRASGERDLAGVMPAAIDALGQQDPGVTVLGPAGRARARRPPGSDHPGRAGSGARHRPSVRTGMRAGGPPGRRRRPAGRESVDGILVSHDRAEDSRRQLTSEPPSWPSSSPVGGRSRGERRRFPPLAVPTGSADGVAAGSPGRARASRRDPASATIVAESVEKTSVPPTGSASAITVSPGLNCAGDERPRERVLDEALDGPLERPGAIGRVRAFADDEGPRGRRQVDDQVVVGESPLEVSDAAGRRSRQGRHRSARGRR